MKKDRREVQKVEHHLWGVRQGHRCTWEYIRPCTNDRRAIMGLDVRKFSQLEIREANTGKTTQTFAKEIEE